MAERVGFEPTVQLPAPVISSHVDSARLSHLSCPIAVKNEVWSRRGSNPWPRPCEGRTLPTEPLPHKQYQQITIIDFGKSTYKLEDVNFGKLTYKLENVDFGKSTYSEVFLAEREGFEPPVQLPALQFSRLPESAKLSHLSW